MLVEQLDELCEIGERARQAIDLVDDDDIDPAVSDSGEEGLEGRALQAAAGETPVVIALGTEPPALMGLGLDVGLGRLALGIERVELLLEPMLGGFAGVDRAAQGSGGRFHETPPGWCWRRPSRQRPGGRLRRGFSTVRTVPGPLGRFCCRSPKKRGPFQFVPVISRAISERLV